MIQNETIRTEVAGRVALITLNRPSALNALNEQLMHEVIAALERFDADPTVAVIVLTGSERAFAAGADIKQMSSKTEAEMVSTQWFSDWDRVAGIRKPVIAAVAGYALGGGCELAMMCDLIIAADNAKFGQPEITLGVIPGIGGSQRLTRAIGKSKAMDLILTGRTIDAVEAERTGLVARVVPSESLLGDVMAIAAEIATKSIPVLIAAKGVVNQAFETSLADGIAVERRAFYAGFALDDQVEGMAAFVEKRAPRFTDS